MQVVLPTREYQLFFEHRPDYLYVYVRSEVHSFEIAKRYWVEILSLLHRRKYFHVLVEKDVAQALEPHDVVTLVSQLSHCGQSNVNFAICDHYYEEERSQFEQMVGTNRGLNLRIRPTLTEAERWLLRQPGKSPRKMGMRWAAAAVAA